MDWKQDQVKKHTNCTKQSQRIEVKQADGHPKQAFATILVSSNVIKPKLKEAEKTHTLMKWIIHQEAIVIMDVYMEYCDSNFMNIKGNDRSVVYDIVAVDHLSTWCSI